jgi:protein TonB
MRQYILYSGTFHLAMALALFVFLKPALDKAAQSSVYSVDFIGSQSQAPLQAPSAQPAAQAAVQQAAPPQAAKDYIPLGKKAAPGAFVLPAPSVLKGAKLPPPSLAAAPKSDAQPAQETAQPAEQSSGGSGEVSADFPNFPYPWYITQVRAALWNEWSSRMPSSGAAAAVVTFRINRAGRVEGLRTEKTAGNKLFDFAALASVDQASPFPPLPADYGQPTLTVHVEFKSSR